MRRSCLELLVCVLNMLLASSTFSERQLQELQEQSPSAIGPAGTFNTLKALSHEAKVDSSNTQVQQRCRVLLVLSQPHDAIVEQSAQACSGGSNVGSGKQQ